MDKIEVLLSAPYMTPARTRFEPLFMRYGIALLLPNVNEKLSRKNYWSTPGNLMERFAVMISTLKKY